MILNEPLDIGPRSLFSMILSMGNPRTIVAESFPSDDGFINASGLINGIRWEFHHKQTSDDVIEVCALVWEERHNQKKSLLALRQVGQIYAFGVSDIGDKCRVKITAHYRDSMVCRFLISTAAHILDRVGAWEWGRSEVWRKETMSRIFSVQSATANATQATEVTQAQDATTKSWQLTPEETDMIGKPGRPGLDEEERVYRMALAQEGEEIKARENQKTWKEIAQQINWKYGTSEAGVKKLEEARNLLKRANSDTLAHIAEWRKTRKTRK